MRKRIPHVVLIGVIAASVLAIAPLITSDSVGAMTGLYRDTYTYADGNICEVELYADSDPVGIWGTVTTCTQTGWDWATTLHVQVHNYVSYENGEPVEDEYILVWSSPEWAVGPGECFPISFSADEAFSGRVTITWRVYNAYNVYPGGAAHQVVRHYDYTGYIWDPNQEWVRGIIGNADTGYPIPYARVELHKPGLPDPVVVYTDYFGHYEVMLEYWGSWKIVPSKTGFEEHDGCWVYVSNGELETRNLQLEPSGGGGPIWY